MFSPAFQRATLEKKSSSFGWIFIWIFTSGNGMFEPLRLGRGCNCLEDHPVGLGIRVLFGWAPFYPFDFSQWSSAIWKGTTWTTLSLGDENDHHSCCLITCIVGMILQVGNPKDSGLKDWGSVHEGRLGESPHPLEDSYVILGSEVTVNHLFSAIYKAL